MVTGKEMSATGCQPPGVVLLRDSSALSPRDDLPPVPVFEGATERGPINDPQLCHSLAEWASIFGVLAPMDHLGYGMREFFMQGGDCCYFKRVVVTEGRR